MVYRKKSKSVEKDQDGDFEMVDEVDTPSKKKSNKKKDRSASVEVVDDSDAGGESSKKTKKTAAKKSKLAVDEDVEEDDEVVDVDGEDEGEEEYAIEKILKHRTDINGRNEYLIHWEGYTSDDDTWEPEDNCTAPELVAKYWKGIPTHKQPRKMQEAMKKLERVKSPRKRGAKASNGSSDDQGSEGEIEDAVDLASAVNGKGSKKNKRESDDDEEEDDGGAEHEAELAETKRLLEKWSKEGNWEKEVESVETITREDDDVLRAHLILKNGDVLWVELPMAYTKCPQAMLQFYENHLRFTEKTKDD